MRLGRSRQLALSVGLSLALCVGTVRPIVAATVSSLTNETLMGSSTLPTNSELCPTPTYSVSGSAAGPYPGSFAETGTIFGPTGPLMANFTIAAAGTIVTGSSKTQGSRWSASCGPAFGGSYHGTALYTATISTPTGTYHDEGTSSVDVTITGLTATLTESFTSSLAQPVPIVPTLTRGRQQGRR
jgi:hypothetical protein